VLIPICRITGTRWPNSDDNHFIVSCQPGKS
jgi:hypothetical protein